MPPECRPECRHRVPLPLRVWNHPLIGQLTGRVPNPACPPPLGRCAASAQPAVSKVLTTAEPVTQRGISSFYALHDYLVVGVLCCGAPR